MSERIHITDAESEIMDALWRLGPLRKDQIVAEVAARQSWGEATVKTLINRLLNRGAIRSERVEGRTHYVPVVQREDYLQAESQSLLDRLFGGRLAPLVAHFAERQALQPDEIDQLKRLIEELGPRER